MIFSYHFLPISMLEEPIYQAYVAGEGWQTEKRNGETAGTTGRSTPIQAIRISIQYKNGPQTSTGMVKPETNQNDSADVYYQAHVQSIGWMDTVKSYQTGGTTGRNKGLEALKISLSDNLSRLGGISVRAHVGHVGWVNPVGNGQIAGTTGQSRRIEAIQIAIVKKSSSNTNANRAEIGVDVSSWQGNNIDWNKVSETASFTIIRAGYRGESGRAVEDTCAVRNINAAKSSGMQVGLYFYSKATNIFQAMEEANIAANIADRCGGISLPIYFDMEDNMQKGLS